MKPAFGSTTSTGNTTVVFQKWSINYNLSNSFMWLGAKRSLPAHSTSAILFSQGREQWFIHSSVQLGSDEWRSKRDEPRFGQAFRTSTSVLAEAMASPKVWCLLWEATGILKQKQLCYSAAHSNKISNCTKHNYFKTGHKYHIVHLAHCAKKHWPASGHKEANCLE